MLIKTFSRQEFGVSDLLGVLPATLLDSFAERFQADKWVQKLKADVVFKLVLYSLLHTERLSLRVMETYYTSAGFQTFAEVAGRTAHNSIRDRLRTIPEEYFAALFEHFYERVSQIYGASELESKYHIRRYDSTMVATFSHLLAGMRVGDTTKQKVQAKFSFEYKDDFLLRASFFHLQKHLSEETALREVISQNKVSDNELIVFDMGIKSRKFFEDCTAQNKRFITRAKTDLRYVVIQENPIAAQPADGLAIEMDAQVQLYSNARTIHPGTFRLLRTRDEQGNPWLFITNITPQELSSEQIPQYYKKRWDIEVLFRFLKQELNLKHFLSHDQNAIAVILYCTLITAMMVLIFKDLNKIKSYKTAKILFVNELICDIIYNAMQSDEGIALVKKVTKPPDKH